jgi:hypothetical protein
MLGHAALISRVASIPSFCRHDDVDDDDVGKTVLDGFQGLVAVGCLADDGDVPLSLEHRLDALPE